MCAQRCCGVRQDNDENRVVGTEWITWGSLLTSTRTIFEEWSKSLMRAGWGMWKRRLDKFYCEALWPWAVSNFLWPLDCSPPGSSVHGIVQARILEWVAISHSRGSSWPRDPAHISCISCTGRQIHYQYRYMGNLSLFRGESTRWQLGGEGWSREGFVKWGLQKHAVMVMRQSSWEGFIIRRMRTGLQIQCPWEVSGKGLASVRSRNNQQVIEEKVENVGKDVDGCVDRRACRNCFLVPLIFSASKKQRYSLRVSWGGK